ncbi:MAG TPA: hypothetical protein V6D26_02875 [Stenomitos sp.]
MGLKRDRFQEQAPTKMTYKRLIVTSYRAILYRVSNLIKSISRLASTDDRLLATNV